MAVLNGYGEGVQYVMGATPPGSTPAGPTPMGNVSIIDGTPVRVVMLALAGAAGLAALHIAGFRFNIGVSG